MSKNNSMNRILLATLFCLLVGIVNSHVFAQEVASPENRLYLNPVFEEVDFTENIVFAEKLNPFGNKKEELRMRIFEPKGDTAKLRPLFVLMPGGGWVVNGDDWMNDVATMFAQAGYVVAIHKYRLSESIGTAEQYFDALAKATSDQLDAIQYLVDDAQAENRFRIDTSKIFIGGHYAGAVTSMHTAYLDPGDSMQPLMRETFIRYDAIAEKQNEYKIIGVINLSGAVNDLGMINRNDVALLSIHGDKDSVVPYDSNEYSFGSVAIDEYANTVGTFSRLFLIEGGLHNDTAIPGLCEECVPIMKRFMFNQLEGD